MIYLLLFLMAILSIMGFVKYKTILNPLTIFNSIWLFTLGLHQLQLSKLQSQLSYQTVFTFSIAIISFSLTFLVGEKFINFKEEKKKKKKHEIIVEKKYIIYMFIVWCVVEVIETIWSGGIPIIWKIFKAKKTYFDYGIPSVHGLMNALGLIIMMLSYYLFEYNNKNKMKKDYSLIIIIVFMLLFYLSLITRQVIISALLELIMIKMYFVKKIPWKRLILFALVGILLFGFVGTFRSGYDEFKSVTMMKGDTNKYLIGFRWVYMYITMTASNVNYMVNNDISGYGLYPILGPFLPTVISRIIYPKGTMTIPRNVVTDSFNVSGYFSEFYVGFGNIGVAFISILYGILGALFYKKIINKTEENILYYAVYIQIILLSFFYNHLLYLPSGFQFIIIFILFKLAKIKGHKNEKN